MTTIKTMKLRDLIPDMKNANIGTQRGRGQLEESMRQHGFVEAGVLDKNNRIIGGNKRAEVAGEIGLDDDVIVIDHDGSSPVYLRLPVDLDSDEGRMLAYRLNRIAQTSIDFDPEKIIEDLEAGLPLDQLWFDDEFEQMRKDMEKDLEALDITEPARDTEHLVVVECENESHQVMVMRQLTDMGLICRAIEV